MGPNFRTNAPARFGRLRARPGAPMALVKFARVGGWCAKRRFSQPSRCARVNSSRARFHSPARISSRRRRLRDRNLAIAVDGPSGEANSSNTNNCPAKRSAPRGEAERVESRKKVLKIAENHTLGGRRRLTARPIGSIKIIFAAGASRERLKAFVQSRSDCWGSRSVTCLALF